MPILPNTEFEDKLASSNFGQIPGLVSTSNVVKTTPDMSIDELSSSLKSQASQFLNTSSPIGKPELISPLSIDKSGRYDKQLVGWNNEDIYGSMQSNWDKAANGVLKTINLAGTTFLQGTVGLIYGLGNVIAGNGANSFYNNDFSQAIQKWNDNTENTLPNYYTNKESNAAWYSTDNLFTANFLFDKLIKNAGFSLGAIYSGGLVSKAISATMRGVGLFSEVAQASKVVNALEDVLPATSQASRLSKYQEIINNALPKLTAPTVDRAITSFLGAATEGGIEALQGLNDYRTAKLSQFQQDNGRGPNETELKQINDEASSLGNARFFLNIGLLSATNYIQLPKILGSKYSTSKAIANTEAATFGEAGGIVRNAEGTFEKAVAKTKIGRVYDKLTGVSKYVWAPMEAFEEGAQQVIQEGTKDYYGKKYGGGGQDFLSSLEYGVKQLSTKEGMESIILGGLSGGLQQIRGNIRETGQEHIATGQLITSLNNTQEGLKVAAKSDQWLLDMKAAASRGINLIHEGEKYIQDGNILEVKDNEADQAHNYLAARIKNGRYDLVKEDITNLRQQSSTQQGLETLITNGYANENDTIESFQKRLSNFEKHADLLKPTFEALNLKYGGMFTSSSTGEKQRIYPESAIDQMAYAVSKVADYDQRIPELSQELLKKGVPLQDILDVTNKENYDNAIAHINALSTTIDEKSSLQNSLHDIMAMHERRQAFLKQYDNIVANPSEYKEPIQSPIGTTIKAVTKDGEKEFVAGEEYYAGAKQIETNEKGTISKFAKFTILGESEGGKGIIIKDSKTGRTTIVLKDSLEDFKITKTKDANPNAQFYIENTGNIFTYNIGKKENNPKGSIEYRDGNLYFHSLDNKFVRRITRDQLSPQINKKTGEKYDVAQIYSSAKFTEKAQQALEAPIPQEEQRDKLSKRRELVAQLVTNTSSRIEDIKKSVSKKQEQLSNQEKEIEKLLNTKQGVPRKRVAKAALKTIEHLGNTKLLVLNEIDALKEEQIELENSLPYFQDLLDNLDILDEDITQVTKDLKEDINQIKEIIDNTKEAIINGDSLIKNIDEVISTAYSLLKDYISRIKEESPIYGVSSIEEYQTLLEKYLGEEGAKQFVENKEGFTLAIKGLQSDISDFEEELGISKNEEKISKLQEQLKDLNKGLEELINEKIAKAKVLEYFQEKIKEFKAQQEAEKALQRDLAFQEKLFNDQKKAQQSSGVGSLSPDAQAVSNKDNISTREAARKPISVLFNSTVTPKALDKPSDKRHAAFLSGVDLLSNRGNIKRVYVTKNNEEAFKLKGLTDSYLNGYSPKEGEELILALYIEQTPEGQFFINGKGEQIGKVGIDTPAQENIIYAPMPSTLLEDSEGKRYSKGTEEEALAWQEAYKKKRDTILSYTDETITDDFQASRGVPILSNEKEYILGNLVSETQLDDFKQIIQVSTLGTIEHQGRAIPIPIGSTILQNGSTFEFVDNRNLNQKEAASVFSVLKEFVRKANDEKEFNTKLLSYLQGILYFKSPYSIDPDTKEETKAPVARNQFYYRKGNFYFGENEVEVPFTTESLEANKETVMFFLEGGKDGHGAYHNINNKFLSTPAPFISFNEALEEKQWPSYQHYLLSKEGRTKEEVPLSTNIRPIDPSIPEDHNFLGKYSYSNLLTQDDVGIDKPEAPIQEEQKQEAPKYRTKAEEAMAENAAANTEASPAKQNKQEGFLSSMYRGEKGASEPTPQGTSYSIASLLGEEKKDEEEVITPKKTGATLEELRKQQNNKTQQDESQYRIVGAYNYTIADVEAEKAYIEKNSPFSVSTITNLINAGNGVFAWGSYVNSLITLSEKMEEGTGYHEFFEGIYDAFLNKEEKYKIYKEFSSREGTFIDRTTGEETKYSDATPFQAKEQMAEEFRDFKLYGEMPTKVMDKGGIMGFFQNLLNWIKSIFTGEIKSLNHLFERMDSAYYKNVPFKQAPSGEKGLRQIGEFDVKDTDTVVKGVVSKVFQNIFQEGNIKIINELDLGKFVPKEIYDKINEQLRYYYLSTIAEDGSPMPNTAYASLKEQGMADGDIDNVLAPIAESLFNNWTSVINRTTDLLRTFKITQTLEEEGEEDDKGRGDDGYLFDAFQYDGKKNAPASIKLLIATLQKSAFVKQETTKIGESSKFKQVTTEIDPSTRMPMMVDYAKTFNSLLEQLHKFNTIDEKENELVRLAQIHPEYVRLANRLKIGKEGLSMEDLALKTKFYNTFSKQHPIPLNMYMLENGNSSMGAADTLTAQKQLQNSWLSLLKSQATYKGGKYIYDSSSLPKDVNGPQKQFLYLAALGIKFSPDQMANIQATGKMGKLVEAISTLRSKVFNGKDVDISNINKLQAKGPLDSIFNVFLQSQNLAPESVVPGIDGEYKQAFVQTNAVSRATNDMNIAPNREQLLQELPHLEQEYSTDSYYLSNLLFTPEGRKTELELRMAYIQGIITLNDGDNNIPIEKLNKSKRLLQAINQNLNEFYYTLIPADSQTEWMVKMKNIFVSLNEETFSHFYSYYENEQALGGSKNRLFSFMNDSLTREEFDKQFTKFILSEVEGQFKELQEYGIITAKTNGKYIWNGLDDKFSKDNSYNPKDLTLSQINDILTLRSLNFAFNNIEQHKLFFGDPAAYKDPTKRYKSFLSPREQSIYGSREYNDVANKEMNLVGIDKQGKALTKLRKGEPGYQKWSDEMKTVTLEDAISANDLKDYNDINGTDAQALSTPASFRQMMYKSSRWKSNHEEQYQYLMAKDRLLMEEDVNPITGKKFYEYSSNALKKHDEKITAKRDPEVAQFSPLKPIVSGFNENGPLLDKYSIAMFTYASVRGTNLAAQYKRMIDNEVDYVIYESGRKVGNKGTDSIYNADGSPNTALYNEKSIVQVPFKWWGIQVETQGTKDSQTFGSQLGKLGTINLMSAGVPIDYEGGYDKWEALSEEEKNKISPIYSLVAKERSLREAMTEAGYQDLLHEVGISKDGTVSKDKLLDLIKDELTRRDLNDNLKEALKINDDTKDFQIPLEALNNYEQIKNIIYSYVNKYISQPKLSGGPKIQVSGTGWEIAGHRIQKSFNKKTGKAIYTSTGLKFYTKEKPWMEVLLPNWFSRKLRAITELQGMSNEEILKYVNNSPDGEKILSGIGFRIPTQELNSAEVFRIKGFLPDYLGDMVVVPEAITKKSGGDFDVDKLNTYLKNVYVTGKKELRLIPYFGEGEKALQAFRDLIGRENLEELLAPPSIKDRLSFSVKDRISSYFKDADNIIDEIEDITKEQTLEDAKNSEDLALRMYKKSLENEYFQTLEDLLSLPQNFDRLIAPNHSEELQELRDDLLKLVPEEFGQGQTSSVLSSIYMNNLRHMYLEGKGGVGIAAVAQTNTAISQKSPIIVDPSRRGALTNSSEKEYIGDASIKLPSNTIDIKGKKFNTLSGITDKVGRYISDKISQFINGFVDITKDPFLVQMGVTKSNAGLYLMLEKLGVPTPVTVMFMNQPIIREYNKMLEKQGSSYPYIKDNIDVIRSHFNYDPKNIPTSYPTQDPVKLAAFLKGNIDGYYNHALTQEQHNFQQFILTEYLKYSVMAANLFRLTQATNFDTARFTNPYLFLRKLVKLRDAQNNNIFSSANDLLENTFIGTLSDRIGKATKQISDAFFRFLHSDIQPFVFPTIERLAERKKLRDDEYVKAARKVEQSFISFLIQNTTKLNTRIEDLLINEETSLARSLAQLKQRLGAKQGATLSNNIIIQDLLAEDKASPLSTKTVRFFNKARDVFSQNTYIAAMEELKASQPELYGKLIRVAFLQSGIAQSPISFTEIIPVEDFKAFVAPALKNLYDVSLLKAFGQTDAFYRNSWKDSTIVPRIPNIISTQASNSIESEMSGVNLAYEPSSIKNRLQGEDGEAIYSLANKKGINNFQAFKVFTNANNWGAEFLSVKLGQKEERKTYLLKKLRQENGEAYINKKNEKFQYGIYYSVNPWGDGYKGQEYYDSPRQSQFTNEAAKLEGELSPEEIISALQGKDLEIPKEAVSLPTFEDFKKNLDTKDC